MQTTRRRFMANAGAVGAGALLTSACGDASVDGGSFVSEPVAVWLQLIGTTEQGGRDYAPRIDGMIPDDLRGSLYRNGPGLFERGRRR